MNGLVAKGRKCAARRVIHIASFYGGRPLAAPATRGSRYSFLIPNSQFLILPYNYPFIVTIQFCDKQRLGRLRGTTSQSA